MKKKISSTLLAFCLLLSLLPATARAATDEPALYVGNTAVNPPGTGTVYWQAAAGGYAPTGTAEDYDFSVSYDAGEETFTLRMNGLDLTADVGWRGSPLYGIKTGQALRIVLENGSYNTVTVEATGKSTCGIYAGGNLSISGKGWLNVHSENPHNGGNSAYGISSGGSITVVGGTVTVSATEAEETQVAFDAQGSITIIGGAVYAYGGRNAFQTENGTINPSVSTRCAVIMTRGDTFTPTVLYSGDEEPAAVGLLVGGFPFACDDSDWPAVQADTVYGDFDAQGTTSWTVSYRASGSWTYDLTLAGLSIGGNQTDYAINAERDLNLTLSGANTLGTEDNAAEYGIYCSGNLNISGAGSLDITAEESGVYIYNGDILVSGAETALRVTANADEDGDARYGLCARGGMVKIADAEVFVEKRGSTGDGIWASDDIRISGSAQVKVIDWSEGDVINCGLHSEEGSVAVGGNANVNIASQSIGIYADDAYIGYVYSETGGSYTAEGGPTVSINDPTAIAELGGSFTAGSRGIFSNHEVNIAGGTVTASADGTGSVGISALEISITGGSITASGQSQALEADDSGNTVGVTISAYRYRTNTAPSAPETEYQYFPGTAFDASHGAIAAYKYVHIASILGISRVSAEHGSFTVKIAGVPVTTAAVGETITLSAQPDENYSLSTWNVYRTGDDTTVLTVTGNSFVMPDFAVTVEAAFTRSGSTGDGASSPSRTIAVTESSSPLFSGGTGAIKAEANMTNAFSSSVEVKVTDTQTDAASFGLGAGMSVYPFDISLYIKNTNTKTKPADGYAVTIFLPVPENLLDVKNQLSVLHKADDGTVTTLPSILKQVDGVWYLVFEATEFSPYALAAPSTGSYDESSGLPYYMEADNRVFIGFAANGTYIAPTGKTVSVTPNGKNFSDIAGHWALSNIGFVTEREIFVGTGADIFSPDIGMTRAMFAAVIGRLYERSFGEIEASDEHVFTDCDYSGYYGKYVDWAAENDILEGIGDSRFAPGKDITREQMAAILYYFADFLGVLPEGIDDVLTYPDAEAISAYAETAALYCQTTGIIAGRDGGLFAPQETATRAEVAAIMERFVASVLA